MGVKVRSGRIKAKRVAARSKIKPVTPIDKQDRLATAGTGQTGFGVKDCAS